MKNLEEKKSDLLSLIEKYFDMDFPPHKAWEEIEEQVWFEECGYSFDELNEIFDEVLNEWDKETNGCTIHNYKCLLEEEQNDMIDEYNEEDLKEEGYQEWKKTLNN